MFRPNKNFKIFFKFILGPLLAVWLFYSLYSQIKQQPDLNESLQLIKKAPFGSDAWRFWLVIVMVFANWGIEARKWQTLIKGIQKLPFFMALKGVLSGVTLSLNTPNRMGEYGGRILYIEDGNRIKAIALSIAGSLSQLLITLSVGCGGLAFLITTHRDAETIMGLSIFWLQTLLYLCACGTGILLLVYFRLSIIMKFIDRLPFFSKFARYLSVIEDFTSKVLLRLLWLSFLRYLIFVLQYVLLLQVLQVHITAMHAFWLISVLFLVLAIIPSFAIADIGIRGKFSVALLGLYSTNTVGIIGTAFGIWLLNLFIPALTGSLLILTTKIFKDKKRIAILKRGNIHESIQ
ncbi:hypothetical protein BH09BAC2_BH09BAC2_01890 [soil metagenome]